MASPTSRSSSSSSAVDSDSSRAFSGHFDSNSDSDGVEGQLGALSGPIGLSRQPESPGMLGLLKQIPRMTLWNWRAGPVIRTGDCGVRVGSVSTWRMTARCCCEVEKVYELVDQFVSESRVSIECITEHPWFEGSYLNPWILKAAYTQYRQQYAPMVGTSNERYRYTAYRQFVHLAWGWLGRHSRVVLPACAETKIREAYPSTSGTYTNFKIPDL